MRGTSEAEAVGRHGDGRRECVRAADRVEPVIDLHRTDLDAVAGLEWAWPPPAESDAPLTFVPQRLLRSSMVQTVRAVPVQSGNAGGRFPGV